MSRVGFVAMALAAAVAGSAVAAGPPVPMTRTDLGGGLYMLAGKGGNLALSVGEDGAFLVDDQFAEQAPGIRAAIAEVTDAPVRFLVNTHWHGDHSGGNEAFGKGGAVIVAHEEVRRRMSTPQFLRAFSRQVPASPQEAWPVVTFSQRVTFHWNDDDVVIRHFGAGHTDGDAVVQFRKADVIHTGDTFFNGFYPFIDASSGGSLDGMIRTADLVLALAGPETRIIPGHGPLARRDDLVRFREMLAGVREVVRPLLAQGKSADELVVAKPTAAWDAEWGGGFLKPDAWVRILYDAAQ